MTFVHNFRLLSKVGLGQQGQVKRGTCKAIFFFFWWFKKLINPEIGTNRVLRVTLTHPSLCHFEIAARSSHFIVLEFLLT